MAKSSQPTVGYRIRVAQVEDLAFLADVERSAAERFRETPYGFVADSEPLPLKTVHRCFELGKIWVAVNLQEQVIGFAIARPLAQILYVQELGVRPTYGRLGIGTDLMQTVCAWASEQAYPAVCLSTFRDIPWNAPFYAKQGFVAVSESQFTVEQQQIRQAEAKAGLPVGDRVIMVYVISEATS